MRFKSLFKAKKPETGIGLCISYPKSGRTWLRVMLDELGVPLQYGHGGSAFHHKTFRDPRDLVGKRKILFLHRNPIDTTVSGYFQVTKREAWRNIPTGSVSDFVRDKDLGLARTLKFNSMWLNALAADGNSIVTTYEALHDQPSEELGRIANWFGVSVSDEQIEAAVAAGAFDTMKAKESAGVYDENYQHRLQPGDAGDPDSFKVRKGVVGGYTQYLNEDDVAYCRNLMQTRSGD